AHSLALCADGSLAAWGSNNNGQLGNNTIIGSSVPTAVTRTTLGSGEKFTDLATGSSASHVMALAAFHVSSNSTLSGLALSSGSLSPTFAGGTTVYAASVTNATTSVTVTPSVTEANATVKVNGALVTTGTASASIPLVVGNSPITVQVTAQDGITTSTYTVTVTRVSTVSTLSGLALSAGSLSPAFAGGTTVYAASVTNATTSVTVTPSVTEANATVKVNGALVTTGTASASIPLVVGNSPITVQVTAQDGITTSTYTVTVTRVSTVSTLSGLALSAGSLSPAFATGTTTYTTTVTTGMMSVTPTATDSNATVTVNGVSVATGAASASIPLVLGTNPINVQVTAQDGTTKSTYTVNVTRLSTVSTLAGLAISPGTLSPAFATGTTGYMAIMPATATGVSVTPSVTDPTATIKVDGATVASGASSATIPITDTQAIATVVTAQDGSTTTYTLTVAICGFEAWQTRVFIDPADLNNPAVSGELEMPAHDGITNLMKYALALDPMICGTAGLPTVAQQDGYLTLTYRKNKTVTDVTYTVQVADDLTGNAWTPATTVVSQTDQGDHWRVTVRDSVPYAGQARRFMRLQVGK
ncbi:MAG: cadherin-like beta sandwich domain-containing protein, partial [Verrucomicrobiota bacterium]